MRIIKTRPSPKVSLPLTALIDIVFLLLVYFLLTSSFVQREGLELELPRAVSGTAVRAPLTLQVKRNGEIFFEGQKTRGPELVELLRGRLSSAEEKRVLIEADRRAPLSAVVSAMDAARLAGAKNISLITEKPPGP